VEKVGLLKRVLQVCDVGVGSKHVLPGSTRSVFDVDFTFEDSQEVSVLDLVSRRAESPSHSPPPSST
jgi:hypothetical protein